MSVPFNLGSTFCGGLGVCFRGLTTLLALVNDPENQRNEKGYKHRPEQQREQHAEEATAHHRAAHHLSHAAHHAATTQCRDEQQDDDRPDQNPKEYLQAVAHGLTRLLLYWCVLSVSSGICACMSKIVRLPDQL